MVLCSLYKLVDSVNTKPKALQCPSVVLIIISVMRAEFVLAIENLDKSLKRVPTKIKLEFIMTHS